MGEALLTRRGGSGSGKAFAVISVEYPAGNVCTCTNGAKTLTAKNTSGLVNFLIPKAGNWIVSCTDGTNSVSKAVNITTEGQSASVVLGYELVLFDNGNYAPETGGWTDVSGGKLSKSHGANYNMSGDYAWACYTQEAIDLSNYSKLCFVVDSYSPAYYPACEFGVGQTQTSHAVNVEITGTGTVELDISELSGVYYPTLYIGGASQYNSSANGITSVSISKVWLKNGGSNGSGGSDSPGGSEVVIIGATITEIN